MLFDERHTVDFLQLNHSLHVQKTILTHRAEDCDTRAHCAFHNPSNHALNKAPTVWKVDAFGGKLYRRCEHTYVHPDRDEIAFRRLSDPDYRPVHNCDGCC